MKNLFVLIAGMVVSVHAFADSSCGLGKGFKEYHMVDHSLDECMAAATKLAKSEEALKKGIPVKTQFSYSKSEIVTRDNGKTKEGYDITGEVILKPVTKAHHQIPANAIDKR